MTAAVERVESAAWRDRSEQAAAEGFAWFDALLGVDEPERGVVDVVLHLATPDLARRLTLRTAVARDGGVLPTVSDLWDGAAWSEREVHEMLGVGFDGHPALTPLLLAPGAPRHPLRRDVLLAARQRTPWPGAADPSDRRVGDDLPPAKAGGRRRLLPPGVAAAPAEDEP